MMGDLTTISQGTSVVSVFGSWQWIVLASVAVTSIAAILIGKIGDIMKGINAFREEWAKLHKPKPHDYHKQVKSEADITNHLRIIRRELQCDRVLVMQLHNGTHSIARVPFLRYSCTSEHLSKGTTSIMNQLQDINANLYGCWNGKIFDGQNICFPDVSEISKNNQIMQGAEQFIRAHDVLSLYIFPLQDSYGKTYGSGVVEFCHEKKDLELDLIKWTHNRFLAIGAILAGFAEPEDGVLE
jgi:hypothetical protein